MPYSAQSPTSQAARMEQKPTRPLLRVVDRNGAPQYFWLHKGKQGSLQTAAQMARLVREDTVRDQELQRFAAQILINNHLDSHAHKRDIVGVIFAYVKQIKYIHDPAGSFDAVQSARQTIEKGFGDCDDLSVLLATLLAQVGLQPRFVLARYKPNSKGYDHVYVDVVLPENEGGRIALDPSSARRGAGWESLRSIERLYYPIFAGPITTLGAAMNLALTGASVGLNFVPVVGPILSALIGPVAGLFNRAQQRSEEAARDQYRDQVYQGLAQIERAVATCQINPQTGRPITTQEGQQAARELINAMYQACDQFTKKSVAQSCRNYETQDVPGGAQEGAFRTRTERIAQAGGNCNAGSGGITGTNISAGLTGLTSNLPLLIALAIGGYLILKRR